MGVRRPPGCRASHGKALIAVASPPTCHPTQTQAALQEALRLNPPGWMTSRECVEATDIGGWAIPKGSVVYIDIRGIQRDPGEFGWTLLCRTLQAHRLKRCPMVASTQHVAEHWGPDPLAYRPERFLPKDGPEAQARHPLAHMVRIVGGAWVGVGRPAYGVD